MMRRPCAAPGCGVLVAHGSSHCRRHAKAAEAATQARGRRMDAKRRERPWRRWYNSAEWRARRAAQLAAEPLCRRCAERGVTKAAELADHVEPHRGDPNLFWFGALQSLCWSCHSGAKQREERAGGG